MVDLTNIFFLLLDTESVTKIISEKVSVITINNMIIVGRVSKLCAVAVNLHLPVCLFVWTCATNTVCTFPHRRLGTGSNNQNGNLRWFLPLGVDPPPLMAQISRHFFTPLFSFAIESYTYETDFTLQKYHF